MKVSIGRMVTFKGHFSNGTDEHPAVITRDWSNGGDPLNGSFAVNLTVFPDCGVPVCMSSVLMYDSREAAEASGYQSHRCFWPDRV